MSIAMAVVMSIAVSSRVVVAMVTVGLVAIIVVAIPPVEVTSMAMGTVATTSLRRIILLVRDIRVGLVAAKLPLAVLFLPDVIVQSDGLVKERLIGRCISHRKWYLQLSLESIEELLLPLGFSINILWSISR